MVLNYKARTPGYIYMRRRQLTGQLVSRPLADRIGRGHVSDRPYFRAKLVRLANEPVGQSRQRAHVLQRVFNDLRILRVRRLTLLFNLAGVGE
jgi:hypothetical protein